MSPTSSSTVVECCDVLSHRLTCKGVFCKFSDCRMTLLSTVGELDWVAAAIDPAKKALVPTRVIETHRWYVLRSKYLLQVGFFMWMIPSIVSSGSQWQRNKIPLTKCDLVVMQSLGASHAVAWHLGSIHICLLYTSDAADE